MSSDGAAAAAAAAAVAVVAAAAAAAAARSGEGQPQRGIGLRIRPRIASEMLRSGGDDGPVAAVVVAAAAAAGSWPRRWTRRGADGCWSGRGRGGDGAPSCAAPWTRERERATELCCRRRPRRAFAAYCECVWMTWSCAVGFAAAAIDRSLWAPWMASAAAAVLIDHPLFVPAATGVLAVAAVALLDRGRCRSCRLHCRCHFHFRWWCWVAARAAVALIGGRSCHRWLPDPWLAGWRLAPAPALFISFGWGCDMCCVLSFCRFVVFLLSRFSGCLCWFAGCAKILQLTACVFCLSSESLSLSSMPNVRSVTGISESRWQGKEASKRVWTNDRK